MNLRSSILAAIQNGRMRGDASMGQGWIKKTSFGMFGRVYNI